jgi:Smg protein
MFDVLVYLYENYGAFDACPDADALGRSLADAGFDADEIREALLWLQGLTRLIQADSVLASPPGDGTRLYVPAEVDRLGRQALGFLMFLDRARQVTPQQREIIIERALATPEAPVSLATLKIIVLMVLWSHSADIDFLLLEELLDGDSPKLLH